MIEQNHQPSPTINYFSTSNYSVIFYYYLYLSFITNKRQQSDIKMFYFFSSINSLCQTCQLYRFLELHNSKFIHWDPFRIPIVSFYKFCTKQTICLPNKRCLIIGFIVKVHYMKMKNRCYNLLRICEISPTIFMDKNFILQVLKVT